MSGGFFRGTSTAQDPRFADKQAKLLKSQKFAPGVQEPVDMSKVNRAVMEPWIARRVTELLGLEDEVLINFIYGLLEGKKVDGRQIQIQLTGFMEKHTLVFMKELWALLLSAQQNVSGIPQQFLDEKAEEAKRKKMEEVQLLATIEQKRRDDEGMNLEVEMARLKAQEAAARLSAAIFGGPPLAPLETGGVAPLAAGMAPPLAGGGVPSLAAAGVPTLAGGTAATRHGLATDAEKGEATATTGVVQSVPGTQGPGGAFPNSTAGSVHELQVKQEEARAGASSGLRVAEGAQEPGTGERGRSPRSDRRWSPARHTRPRSHSHSRSQSRSRSRSSPSSRSPSPRTRARPSGGAWRSPRSPVRHQRSPPRYGRPRDERPYGRGGEWQRGRARDSFEDRGRDQYDGRGRDLHNGRGRDQYDGRGREYEGDRSRGYDGQRDRHRGFRQRGSPDGASDGGAGQEHAGARYRAPGSPRASPPPAAAARGRGKRAPYQGAEGNRRREGRSVSPSPPRAARGQAGSRHTLPGPPRVRSPPAPHAEERTAPQRQRRVDEEAPHRRGGVGEEEEEEEEEEQEDAERLGGREREGAQGPTLATKRVRMQSPPGQAARVGAAGDATDSGRRMAPRLQDEDATALPSRPALRRSGPGDAAGVAGGSWGKGQGGEKSRRRLAPGKRPMGSQQAEGGDMEDEEGAGEEEEEDEEDEEGEEEEQVPMDEEKGKLHAGEDRGERGRRTRGGEPGVAHSEGEESRREAKRVRREERRQRKEERRRKREERKKRQEERNTGTGTHKPSSRAREHLSGNAEGELAPSVGGSDHGSLKAQPGHSPSKPSKAVEEELRQRAMLSLRAKRAQTQGSD